MVLKLQEKSLTASAIISFAQKLEDEASQFYAMMAEKTPEARETLLVFAKEGQKNKTLINRTYQETISDALETGFSFKNIVLNDYLTEINLKKDVTPSENLKIALIFEQKAVNFYLTVAEQSKSLLATIPRAFMKVAETRKNRIEKIQKIIGLLE